MTIAAVARGAGISASALSQIESGAVNPSLATLRRLASTLGRPIGGLFDAESPLQDRVVRHGHRKRFQLPGSPVMYEMLSPNLMGSLEVLYYEVPVGSGTIEATHPGEETVVVVEGVAEVQGDGSTYTLAAWDAVTFTSSIPHFVRNLGDGPLRILCCFTPPNL